MIRVVICDDHPIVREGLKKTLAQYPDVAVAGEAGTGGELLSMLRNVPCDVVVLDISLPDRNGLDVLKQLACERQGPAVIILSMHSEEQYALRALKAGARGYLEKASIPEELITALRKVAAGGMHITASLAERLAREVSGAAQGQPHEKLSDREYQVLRSVATGKGIKQIAQELFLSPTTVATYRARALAKLDLRTTADLIHYAIEHRLL
jgi:two-component system invasion response regulator UvrY